MDERIARLPAAYNARESWKNIYAETPAHDCRRSECALAPTTTSLNIIVAVDTIRGFQILMELLTLMMPAQQGSAIIIRDVVARSF